jgi:GNAT superfamily N-acetyltransferase
MNQLLDNIFWHSLSGPHAQYACGAGGARRYAPGFSPILGFKDAQDPDFAALGPYCEPGEHFYCSGWTGAAPAGWRVDAETTMFRMFRDSPTPPLLEAPAPLDIVRLGPEHAQQALELATLTRPGPFGPRTTELGEYFGCFDGGRLVALAGERSCAPGLREISGVCTHPDFQGRGLARALMITLIALHIGRGETSFLHVMRENEAAHRMYLRMGFRDYVETPVRVVSVL